MLFSIDFVLWLDIFFPLEKSIFFPKHFSHRKAIIAHYPPERPFHGICGIKVMVHFQRAAAFHLSFVICWNTSNREIWEPETSVKQKAAFLGCDSKF